MESAAAQGSRKMSSKNVNSDLRKSLVKGKFGYREKNLKYRVGKSEKFSIKKELKNRTLLR